eukprot:scaffold1490_cov162-Ochromonas_danica.AAC.27
MSNYDAEKLFKRLDVELLENIESQYFQEPREFRSLIEVLKVLNDRVEQLNRTHDFTSDLQTAFREKAPRQLRLQQQLDIVNKVIEEVVTFQHGGLNHSVDTMGDVVREYSHGREEIKALRVALAETKSVLTAKKDAKTSLRELWLKKVELQESLRMVRDLEELKNTPLKVQHLMSQKKYLTTVVCLSSSVKKMFGEDLVRVGALVSVREKIMDLKEVLLESCVAELKEAVIGGVPEFELKELQHTTRSDTEEEASDARSEVMSVVNASQHLDDSRSVVSFRPPPSTPQTGPSGGFSVYRLSQEGSMGSSAVFSWSLDLREVDESAEAVLLDPSSAGPLFIRLLVKTVHLLHCEEDVERMVLDNLQQSFIDHVLVPFKDMVQSQLQAALNEMPAFGSEEEEVAFHGRVFCRYVSSLLDALLGMVQRLLYVCRLLAVSKDLHQETSNSQKSSGTVLAVAATTPVAQMTANETSKKVILELWDDLESLLVREMRVHLLEMEVEKISDRPTSVQLPKSFTEQKLSSPFPSSTKGAQRRGRRASSLLGGEGEDDEERRLFEGWLVFKPSARHSASLFRKAVAYSIKCSRILKDNGLEEEPSDSLKTSSPVPTRGLTVLESQARNAMIFASSSSGQPIQQNKVLLMLQQFLESELVPVIQSDVNQAIRELQLHAEYFAWNAQVSGLESWVPNPEACTVAWPMCETLFRYWLQLFQHRTMVTVVIDRLIRGFALSAREARESSTFSFVSAEGSFNKQMCKVMRGDPLYWQYKQRVHGGRRSLEEALQTASSSASVSGGIADGIPLDDRAMLALYVKEVSVLWGTPFWDLTSGSYPVNSQKVLKSSAVLGGLACNSYCADWLVRRTIHLANHTSRQGAGALLQTLAFSSAASSSPTPGISKSLRQELYESKSQLAQMVLEALRDVSRVSDEALAMLRAELQLLCFYYFSKLASMPFLPTALSVGNTNGAHGVSRGAGPEEELLASFAQQVGGFLQAVQSTLSPFALPLLLGPLAALLPRLLTRVVILQYSNQNSSIVQAMSATWKGRLLRLVVSVQQQLSLLIQNALNGSSTDLAEPRRLIIDVLTVGSETLRKFLGAIDMSSAELRTFVSKHGADYSREEIQFLWTCR